MNRSSARRTFALALLIASLCLPAGHAADSFYLNLLNEGIRNSEVGRHQNAVRKLRIACFGFLDEPELLARGLVYLANAQAATEDRIGFRDSFDRLADIEERFSSYSLADLSSAERQEFQRRAVSWIPEIELLRIPVFEAILAQAASSEPDELSARQLRRNLRQELVSDPENRESLWRLAELEWQEGKVRQASALVDRLLGLDPAHHQALCLQGMIGEKQGRCDPAQSGLPLCADLGSNPVLAAFFLDCLSQAEEWDQARIFGDSLDPALLSQKRISRLVSTLPEAGHTSESDTDPVQIDGAPEPMVDIVTQDLAALEEEAAFDQEITPVILSEEDRLQLEEARQLLLTATRLQDLDGPQQIAAELLSIYPMSQEVLFLAAETAYRGSRWKEAVRHFQQVEPPTVDETLLLFYYAVSLFESGAETEAMTALNSVLPVIERTPFVNSYARRILQSEAVAE